MISYGKQTIDQDDINTDFQVSRSDCLIHCGSVQIYEKDITHYCGEPHFVPSNATFIERYYSAILDYSA